MHHHDLDLASFLERRGDEPVLLWYASTNGDPRDVPRGSFEFTLVKALRHLNDSPDIYWFDIDMMQDDKMRLGPQRVKALMALAYRRASNEIDEGDAVRSKSDGPK